MKKKKKRSIMKAMNSELKKVVTRVKAAQEQLNTLLKNATWVEEARVYAERQSKEVKKLFSADINKVKSFLEKERKQLEKFQRQLPGEVEKLRKFVNSQKKEFEKILTNVRKNSGGLSGKKKAGGSKKSAAGARKKTTKKSSESSAQA